LATVSHLAHLSGRPLREGVVCVHYEGTHHQLCDPESANVIEVSRTEAESLAMVRGLLDAGRDADHLTLGLDFSEDEPGDDADLSRRIGSGAPVRSAIGLGGEAGE